MEPYKIEFYLYANSEQEAVNARKAIEDFIEENRKQGIVVTAKKIAEAVPKWKNNPLIKELLLLTFLQDSYG